MSLLEGWWGLGELPGWFWVLQRVDRPDVRSYSAIWTDV